MRGSLAHRHRPADRTAIIQGSRATTFANLRDTANRIARALVNLGANPSNRVTLLGRNSPKSVASFHCDG
jgi:acyl-CoA synthetase (AMP-forming)/AMP-acid ligase II